MNTHNAMTGKRLLHVDTNLRALETPRLRLEDFSEKHIAGFDAYLTDSAFDRYIGLEATSGAVLLEMYAKPWGSTPFRYYWAIVLKETGETIGAVRLDDYADEDGINLHLEINPTHWGKGYVTEAAEAVVVWGFRVANAELLCATADPRNLASNKVIQKLGFAFEKVLHAFVKDRDGVMQDRNLYFKKTV